MKNRMKILNRIFRYSLIWSTSILLLGCATTVEKKIVSEGLTKIFLNKTKTMILGKFDGKTSKILTISELPHELFFREGTPKEYSDYVSNRNFRDIKLSPDKKNIAFSVECWDNEWSGIYNLITKKIEKWNFFFDSASGYFYWSPNGKYLAEVFYSLKDGYCIEVKDFTTKQDILTIGDEFLQNKVKGLESRKIIKDGEDYLVTYEIKFVKWSDDSRRVFFNIVPECYYSVATEVPLVEKQEKEKTRKDILKRERNLDIWSVDIITHVLKREK